MIPSLTVNRWVCLCSHHLNWALNRKLFKHFYWYSYSRIPCNQSCILDIPSLVLNMFILGCNIIEKITVWNPGFLNTQMAEIKCTQGIHIQYLDAVLFLHTSKTGQPRTEGWYTSAQPPTYLHLLSCVLLFNGVTTLLYEHFITPFYKSPFAHHLWCENQCVKNLSKNDTRCDASYWPRSSLVSLKPAGWILCPPEWESCSRRILLGVNRPVKVISRHLSACFYPQILILFFKPSFHTYTLHILSIYFSSSYIFSNFPSFSVISTLRKHPNSVKWEEQTEHIV